MSLRRWRAVPRPVAGSRLPLALRASRVGRLAAALPTGLEDPGFELLLRRIDRAPLHAGNRVTVFEDGEQAFAAMCAAIGAAERELLLESYIFKDDSTGRVLLEALAAAVRRGVSVRVLADAFGSAAARPAFWDEMRRHGIEVRLFHRLLPRLWVQPFRDHRKILVADRALAFTGGMNIANEYASARHAPDGLWRDTHARVAGPTAWEMAVVFSEGWRRAGGAPLDLPPLQPDGGAPGARILVLDSRPGRGQAESAAVLAAIVGAARRSLWITNSYFAPGRRAAGILAAAAARGVDVRLLLPGISDVPLVRHAGHGHFAELLASGVRIFEYTASVLHAKTLVADARVSLIGTTNLDFRSFRFNAECNLVILDEAIGRRMQDSFTDDLTRSQPIRAEAWPARGWAHRLGDSCARLLSPLL